MSPHVVVAAILTRDGRVLLCHRSPTRSWAPGVWDLPGGHVDGSETREEALERELAEELGIEVSVTSPPWAHLESEGLNLTLYLVTGWTGTVRNLAPHQHDRLDWFTLGDLPTELDVRLWR